MSIYHNAKCWDASGMDIYAIRKQNLLALMVGRTQRSCADRWDTSPSTLSQIVSKNPVRNLGDDLARKIEQAEGLPPGWFDRAHAGEPAGTGEARLAGAVNSSIGQSAAHPSLMPISVWDDETPLDDDEVEVPFLREVELAAGSGRTAIQESAGFKLRFGKRSLRRQGVQPENAVCVTISGNSMEPVLRSGATVGVDRGKKDIVDGDLYAINHGGQLRVKQVYRLPGGGIRLHSFNLIDHPDESYPLEAMQEHGIEIIGRVFWGAMFF